MCYSVFSDLQMLLQCWMLVLNEAKVSQNEVHAFGSEPCRLFQLAMYFVFYSVFKCFSSDVNVFWTSSYGHASWCTQCYACPSPTLLRHCCALLSASRITVSTLFKMAPIKCFFWVNEGHLTLLNFRIEANTRQKLIAFMFLVDLFHMDLFTFST